MTKILQQFAMIWIFGIILSPSLSSAKFADIDTTHPHFHAIDELEKKEIIKGYQRDGKVYFLSRQKVNRAEALKILVLSAEIPHEKTRGLTFPDVPTPAWFSEYVQAAVDQKIVEGYPDGMFRPERNVSRTEFLKMMVVSFDIPTEEIQEGEEWFRPFFNAAVNLNLLDGPHISPYESLSRGEIAELIYRAQKLKPDNFSSRYIYSGEGKVSFYDKGFAGKLTANGEIYDPMDLTAAHRTLPFDTRLKVENQKGDFVIVRINDRGPYIEHRVLDLSRKAFERLALASEGVIDVKFEVYSDTADDNPVIPEQIRSKLSSQSKNTKVPDSLAEVFSRNRTVPKPEEDEIDVSEPAKKPNRRRKVTTPYLGGSITQLSKDFFENALLRREIPLKIEVGTVLKVEGTAPEFGRREATIFLQNSKTKKQTHFASPVSGKNFSIPVFFMEPGNYEIGLVFNDQIESRVGKVEVIKPNRSRKFRASKVKFTTNLYARIVSEESKVIFDWKSGENFLTKIVFSQESNKRILLLEDGLSEISLPYDFFNTFKVDEKLAIDIYQAGSRDGTLANQETNWKKADFRNYILRPGFPDTEKEEISVHDFPRFLKTLGKVVLKGKVLSPDIILSEDIFLIGPKGKVSNHPIKKEGDDFSFSFKPNEYGTYILEIVSNKGEVLFNRGMYFSKAPVLPVAHWKQTYSRSFSATGHRNWINRLRKKYHFPRLAASKELNDFAQLYADKMAHQNYISHITPEGFDLKKRIKMAKLPMGEYGENLSFGTTYQLALNGLENSGSHRQNMLHRKWKRVGVGLAKNEKGEYYVVQVFGK